MKEVLNASISTLMALGLPSLVVLAGILLNQSAAGRIGIDMRDRNQNLKGEIEGVGGDGGR